MSVPDAQDHTRNVHKVLESPNAAIFSSIEASWCRSGLHHGLDPGADFEREYSSGSELARLRDANGLLLEVARPHLDQLFSLVGQTGCAVMLADSNGTILESRAFAGDRTIFEAVGLAPGGQWSENAEGTNGIGTCLVEGRAVTIHREDHFASRNIGISCMDAPIYDAHGRIAAALDVSSCRDDHSCAVAALIQKIVQDSARRIERGIFSRHFSGHRIIDANECSGDTVLLAVDRDDLVVGATRAARMRFQLADTFLEGTHRAADLLGELSTPSFDDAERATLRQALAAAGGNASAAARMLGIGRATLYRRMESAGLLRRAK